MKVLVIGDVMLDVWIEGEASRLSPEAPVPVVKLSPKSTTYSLGGAANVAMNARALGAKVSLMGAVGIGKAGKRIHDLLKQAGIKNYLGSYAGRVTTQKIRVGCQGQQIVRMDFEKIKGLDEDQTKWFFGWDTPTRNFDAVIIADYGKGVICDAMLRGLRQSKYCEKAELVIDPIPENFGLYKKHLDYCVSAITPNAVEAVDIVKSHYPFSDQYDIRRKISATAWTKLYCPTVLITEGKNGLTLSETCEGDLGIFTEGTHFPATHQPSTAADVSGAGDTVTAVFAMALAAGMDKRYAAELANAAAGVVVGKRGTAVCNQEELEDAMEESKWEARNRIK